MLSSKTSPQAQLFLYHGRGIEKVDTRGLRLYRLNLISAHTCVGKPPRVAAVLTLFGGYIFAIADTKSSVQQQLGYKQVSSSVSVMMRQTQITRLPFFVHSNYTVAGTLLRVLRPAFAL